MLVNHRFTSRQLIYSKTVSVGKLRQKMVLHGWSLRQIEGLSRRQKRMVFLAIDALLAPVMFAVALWPRADFDGPNFTLQFPALLCIASIASLALGLPRIKLNAYGRHAALATAKFAGLVLLGLVLFCQITTIPVDSTILAEFGIMLFFAGLASRYAMLTVLLWVLRQGQPRRRVLIYGAGDTGLQMAIALRNHQRILPVAFLDDNVELQAVTVSGLPVFSPARLPTIIRELAADRVLLAMPSASAPKLAKITRRLQALGLDVQALPSFAQLIGTEIASGPIEPGPSSALLGRSTFGGDMPDVGKAYEGKVVLVSGAGGSVGSELCRQVLVHRPKSLVLFERCEIALYTIDRELRDLTAGQDIAIVAVLGSVTDARLARSVMIETGAEVVFHAAAYKHVPLVEGNPVAGLANNMIGTSIFAEAAATAGAARFILISTDKAVRPKSVMGGTKRLAELAVQDMARRNKNTHYSIVRFGNVLGSSGSVLPLFRSQIARGGPITLTHDDATRYFMTIDEAAQLVLVTGAFSGGVGLGDVFVLDMGRPIRIRDLAEQMIRADGLRVCDKAAPDGDIEIVITGLRPGEKLHEELLIGRDFLPTPHPKILRAQEAGLSEFAMDIAHASALAAIELGSQAAAREVIATWVEGFSQQAQMVLPTDLAAVA